MSEKIATFFDAWQLEATDARHDKIASAVSADVEYDDPRTPETIKGVDALSEYVGMFNANAPGWTANVLFSDSVAGMTRTTIAFGGKGPDGKDMVQLGQYFVEMDGDVISRMVGFVGTGEPRD